MQVRRHWRTHPRESVAQSVEQRTFNPWVEGSNPSALTREKHLKTPPFLWETGVIVARRSAVVTFFPPASSRPLSCEKAPRAL